MIWWLFFTLALKIGFIDWQLFSQMSTDWMLNCIQWRFPCLNLNHSRLFIKLKRIGEFVWTIFELTLDSNHVSFLNPDQCRLVKLSIHWCEEIVLKISFFDFEFSQISCESVGFKAEKLVRIQPIDLERLWKSKLFHSLSCLESLFLTNQPRLLFHFSI